MHSLQWQTPSYFCVIARSKATWQSYCRQSCPLPVVRYMKNYTKRFPRHFVPRNDNWGNVSCINAKRPPFGGLQSVKEPPNRQNAIWWLAGLSKPSPWGEGGKNLWFLTDEGSKRLAAQGILTYCATLPSRVSTYTSGSRCLSLVLLWPLQSVKKQVFWQTEDRDFPCPDPMEGFR